MSATSKIITLADGRTITIETGRLARQADGAVVVKMGTTMLLATVVSRTEAVEGADFMPLSVDYQEKYASTGRFPGGFFKREARLSEQEILISRLVDRALRPLFPENFHAEVQVMISLISGDIDTPPDALAALAASSAIAVSSIPFNAYVSEVRVARIDGQFIINPTISSIAKADMDLMVAATFDNITMVEGEMKEVQEADMMEALRVAHEAIKIQCTAQMELAKELGTDIKREYNHEVHDEELRAAMHTALYKKVYGVAAQGIASKNTRRDLFKAVIEEYTASLSPELVSEKAGLIKRYYHDIEWEAVRNAVLDTKTRLDGRALDQIRPIWTEIDYLPSAHGSAIFTRGETQSLTSITLGTKLDEQIIDGAIFEGRNKLLLHYNFPGFSTGEVKPNRGTGRREVGHGNLALRALRFVIPTDESNPYTIRIVSDILESNGSSSMATVCAGSMALMDAGIKITKPVAGIAMGLVTDEKRSVILSDILGDEDHIGDMDFKVTGTADGITACQMDIKVDGLSYELLGQALEQARKGRLHILGEMAKTITQPREDYKPHVPRIEKMMISREFIGAIIGPSGKVIQEMQRDTGTTIIIEEVGEFGVIEIVSPDKERTERAKARIRAIVAVPEVGDVYSGKVKNVVTFGAFVEILPGKEGLLHISELEWRRVENVEDVLKVGDVVDVKLIEVDAKTGKLKLSRKALLPRPDKQ